MEIVGLRSENLYLQLVRHCALKQTSALKEASAQYAVRYFKYLAYLQNVTV